MEDMLVDYNVVDETAGHKKNRGIKLKDAAENMYHLVKEKAMQVAVNSIFITFDTIEDLEEKLSTAVKSRFNITVFDENLGG